jgi:hypothetical protein
MINPQKGIDIMNNTSIIIRILFAITLFQVSTERAFGSLYPSAKWSSWAEE